MKVLIPFMLMTAALQAAPPTEQAPPQERVFDYSTVLEGNNVACFIGNAGNFANDRSLIRGRSDGFYFPNNWPAWTKTVIYDAGLWLSGITSTGDTLVTVAEYSSEYVPGAWGSDPSAATWHVYSITQDQGTWTDWPVVQGAPLAANGLDPWIVDLPEATQMLWAVFNDGNSTFHNNDAGSTDPMDVELRLTAWCSQETSLESTVYLRWEILNQGAHNFTQFYVGFWFDPDLGGSGDDLVGFDQDRQMGFTYNSRAADSIYGDTPPALGAILLYGPHVTAPGDSAFYQDEWHADEANLELGAFSSFINGTDPHSYVGSLFYTQGLSMSGQPRPNGPFDFTGDPLSGWGDFDPLSRDKRMLLSCEPVPLSPGGRQEVALALTAAQGVDRLSSLARLRELAPHPVSQTNPVPAVQGLHFVNVPAGTSQVQSLAVVSVTPAAQILSAATFPDSHFSIATALPAVLAPQDTTWILIQYDAPDLAARTCHASLMLASDESFSATISANGPWILPSLSGDLGPLTHAGGPLDLVIQNVGSEPLIVSDAQSQNEHLSIEGLTSLPIPPGGSAAGHLVVAPFDNSAANDQLVFTANTVSPQLFAYSWRPSVYYHWEVEYLTVDERPVPLRGIGMGGSFFGGGVDFGENFRGSTMPSPWQDPDSYHDIRITIAEPLNWSQAAVYHRPGYVYAGSGQFPGQVWREREGDPPQRLNVCFVESTLAPDVPDGLWNPNSSATGGLEYLLIMDSEYNGGIDYNDVNNGTVADVLWAAWLRRVTEESVILAGDQIIFTMVEETGVAEPAVSRAPALRIASVHPNPFNPTTQVEFELTRPASSARLRLYNLLGQLAWDQELGELPAGRSAATLNPERLGSGLYLLELEAGAERATGKVLLMR